MAALGTGVRAWWGSAPLVTKTKQRAATCGTKWGGPENAGAQNIVDAKSEQGLKFGDEQYK